MNPSLVVLVTRRPKRWKRQMIAALRSRGVDVVVVTRIEECSPGERVLDLRAAATRAKARLPLARSWSVEIGEEYGDMPAFGEALRGSESVEAALVERAPDARVLRQGCFPYASRHARTLERVVQQSAAWICEELESPARRSAPEQWKDAAPAERIGLVDAVRFAFRELVRFAGHALRAVFEDVRWDVAVTNGSLERFIENPRNAWLHWVARDEREFLADPFVMRGESGGPRLLCETMNGSTPSIVSIDLDDRYGERRPVLDGLDAASYPYVFEVDQELWLTPEQHARGSLGAYRMSGLEAEPVTAILEGVAAVDPTIIRHDGRWWLFCTLADDGPNYALRIYWSEHPGGPWHAHKRNPAKVDVRGARPAGNFFLRGGVLHRPAQDCSGRYGRAIAIQRVDVLTPEDFEEACVARIDVSMIARRDAIGVHTLSHGHGWVALDAQFARWSLRKPLRMLQARFT
ncbi:MAG TPA: hypothetical protein VMV82_10380 [Candidatus Dormibacteraeota bacterium]|nr:hypothetical protein [Candidatus Dormibacteraeota bacterium]